MKKGWYCPNSVIVTSIRPEYRGAGGGVTEDMLVETEEEAWLLAERYTKQNILAAEAHLRKVRRELQRD